MTKKQIKKLIVASYTKDNLDFEKVTKISKILTRAELKLYIKLLKNYEQSKTITLFVADFSGKSEITKKIKKMYPKKNIVIKEDKSLIGGIKLIDNDLIYDANIKNALNEMVSFIKN